MRISRALALAGLGSRRKCETFVLNGAVTVNGKVVSELGFQVDPEEDAITFHGRLLRFESFIYYILHKPKGYMTTAADPYAKKTVYELLPPSLVAATQQTKSAKKRVFPVGRLDRDSTGLLLFTNDGDLANRMTHPRYQVAKLYEVRLDHRFDPKDTPKLLSGIRLEEGVATVERLHQVSPRIVRLVIREGKKREVRRIFQELNYEVLELCRIAFGPLTLGKLFPGQGRFLNSKEAQQLCRAVFDQK